MTDEGKIKKAEYARQYREKNRERLNQYRREWNKKNKDKVKAYQENYWDKKAVNGGDNR